ncbi:MAG: hypothetical protein H7836_08190 [Magnetococcus sp. YQC-3]
MKNKINNISQENIVVDPEIEKMKERILNLENQVKTLVEQNKPANINDFMRRQWQKD